MIENSFLLEWRQYAPWRLDSQVEQDLVLSRALTEIFSDDFLRGEVALRGGTALNKLFLKKNLRYSEDIDLVRTKTEKAKPVISAIQKRLDSWLGKPSINQKAASVTMIYRFNSSSRPVTPLRLKIEMNTRESKPFLSHIEKDFIVKSRWFSGTVKIKTFELEEMLGTKLRALYQRKKGRDLLDFDYAFREFPDLDPRKIVAAFHSYLNREDLKVSRAEFEANLFNKMQDKKFIGDISAVILDPASFDPRSAYALVVEKFAPHLIGEPWKGHPDLKDKRNS